MVFNSKSKSRTKGLANVMCYKCKKKGHFKKDCTKLKARDNKKLMAESVNFVTSEDDEFGSMLIISSRNSSSNEWILNSGYSYHM